jgi:hypothetical protein
VALHVLADELRVNVRRLRAAEDDKFEQHDRPVANGGCL